MTSSVQSSRFDGSRFKVSAPAQLKLPLTNPRYRRPTMTVAAAKGMLDLGEDDIIELIEVQVALIAWDIATPGHRGAERRRELRILTQSVAEYQQLNPARCEEYYCAITPDAAINLLLSTIDARHSIPRDFITVNEVQRVFNCGSTHVINLIQSKALALVPKTDYQRGPGGSPSIARESFIEFLTTRYVGGLLSC